MVKSKLSPFSCSVALGQLNPIYKKGRSSHWRCSVKKGVLKNFVNFTGKHLCWSLFLIKLQAFRPAILLKKTPTQVFCCEIAKILRTPILKNICERLLRKRSYKVCVRVCEKGVIKFVCVCVCLFLFLYFF